MSDGVAVRAIRVLVADDQLLIRAGLAALLRAAPGIEVVGEAASGEEAVRLAWSTTPDVVLMDIRMPGLGGIGATERILGTPRPPRVLILTTFDLDEYVYDALRAGAHGFLLKDTPPDRLLAAVATVAAGDMLFAPSITRRLIESYAGRAGRAGTGPAADLGGLTTRECEVVRLVGTGLFNGDIADRLQISEATVKTHLNRAMSKLGLTSRAQVVVLAYETGLVVPGHAE
ncbi:response regulator transcription factor [Rhizomonospora bruguierae]|uniref:response regulator transcription factor n=1 Tax=Rhizomonospora bruguierae TaxID=1581705 RepID=UPI0020BF47B9|nr:response regulator transcription factor [Micromonospora sp. NBRC 107566]